MGRRDGVTQLGVWGRERWLSRNIGKRVFSARGIGKTEWLNQGYMGRIGMGVIAGAKGKRCLTEPGV